MELFKSLKKLIVLFENLRKLDPIDYYARGSDKKFQQSVIELASQEDITDLNLINTLNDASTNFWDGTGFRPQGQDASVITGTPTSLNEYDLN